MKRLILTNSGGGISINVEAKCSHAGGQDVHIVLVFWDR